MAADILLYDSDVVPVGKDQKQHLEVTRDIAVKMNEIFGPVFKLPEPSIREDAATVPGTDGAKMSKSYGNTIEIFAEEKTMKKKIMGIVTDSTPVEAPKDPATNSIYQLFKLFASVEEAAAMAEKFHAGGTGYGDFKKQLFGVVWEYFAPMRQKRAELAADPALVDDVLHRGAEYANALADNVMVRVEKAVGLCP
jgi:tryptophanyl-tRNA synthetase